MLMKNRKLILIAALLLTLSVSLGSTLAYLTDTDEDVNVMTLGNVEIRQHEMQRAGGVAHNAGEAGKGNGVKKGALVPFEQLQALYPAFPVNGKTTDYSAEAADLFYWGEYVHTGTAGNGLWNDQKLRGAMDKMVFVENTGESDCYLRTWFAFECPDGMEYSQGPDREFMMNVNGGSYTWETTGKVEIEGVKYLVMSATYNMPLAPGAWSHPSLLQVVMTHNADNEDMKLLGGTYEILVFSQAVQTTNFPDAATALNAAFGPEYPWQNGAAGLPVLRLPGSSDYIKGDDAAEMLEIIENGGTMIAEPEIMIVVPNENNTIDAGKAEILLTGVGDKSGNFGYLGFLPDKNTGKLVVNDLTVTGAGFVELGDYGVASNDKTYRGGDCVLNNASIQKLEATYHVDAGNGRLVAPAFGHYGTLTMNNCVMKGTTSVYDGYTPYDVGLPNATKTTINGGEYGAITLWAQAKAWIYGAEIGQIDSAAITTSGLGKLVIGKDTHVGTINLVPGSFPPALQIEDGATVDRIVYNGVEYTQDAWLNR